MGYRGYMHLKIMPGAERGQVERAMQLADRVSINLEAPNTERLARLAPHKIFLEELLQPLKWVEEIRRAQPASQVLERAAPVHGDAVRRGRRGRVRPGTAHHNEAG
jgi:predicted DNA-binding helix-hairpin-helix protein